jgi:hypothetical protein
MRVTGGGSVWEVTKPANRLLAPSDLSDPGVLKNLEVTKLRTVRLRRIPTISTFQAPTHTARDVAIKLDAVADLSLSAITAQKQDTPNEQKHSHATDATARSGRGEGC